MYEYENLKSHRKPPPSPNRPPPWRIALLANLKQYYPRGPEDPPDAWAEFDRLDTIQSIAGALERDGHWVHFCHGDKTLVESLPRLRPQICFNIAEGVSGDSRESHAPALCELLNIPYTASRVQAHAISLDKTTTKRLWQSHGLPTPPFQEFRHPEEPLNSRLRFPLFVKPAGEGTGMGVDSESIVTDLHQLRSRVGKLLAIYQQPVLVEGFLPGREFTVGFIGNRGDPANRRRPWLYAQNGFHSFPVLELDNQESLSPGVYGHAAKEVNIDEQGAPQYLCPAPIPERLRSKLVELALRAGDVLDAADVFRVDLRLDETGNPQLMEINTLPGLNPEISDLCIMAAAEGMEYDTLISEILYLAAERFGLPYASIKPEQVSAEHSMEFSYIPSTSGRSG